MKTFEYTITDEQIKHAKKIKNQISSPIYRLTAKTGARNLVLPAEAVTIH